MKYTMICVALTVGVLLFAAHQTLTSQERPTFQGGTQRTLQFENEEVAVWKAVIPPKAPLAMHTHQHPRVIIALTGGTMKVINEDGTSEMHPWETGKAYWLPLSEGLKRHADQNTGSKPIEVMVVELKKAK
jgi:quercetin dioxygenase-like cupin family protein